jgi:hypothetical protein
MSKFNPSNFKVPSFKLTEDMLKDFIGRRMEGNPLKTDSDLLILKLNGSVRTKQSI